MKRFLALVAAMMLLFSVAAMSGCGDSVSDILSGSEKPKAEPKGEASAAYTKVFDDAGIATVDSLIIGQSYAAYVYEEDGYVYRQEYGYLGDTVMTMVDTYFYYIPEGSDPAAVEEYIKGIEEAHNPVNDLSCGSVKFSTVNCLNGGEYYVVTERYENVNDYDAVKELVEAGIVEEGTGIISMEKTDENMMEMGCVKR